VDPEFVCRKLDALLRRKLRTHQVNVLYPDGGGLALAVAIWAEKRGVPSGPYDGPTHYDEQGVFRNASLLQGGHAFIGFGPRATWPPDAEDLIHRAESSFRSNVRVIQG
jgi:hypothetical protein